MSSIATSPSPSYTTRTWRVDPKSPPDVLEAQLAEPAELLQRGELVGFPTETVYGLAGNALSHDALQGIYRAKGRPSDNPLIVHVASMDGFRQLGRDIPKLAEKLAERFWPGPLTIIIPTALGPTGACSTARAGLDCVGVRMPSHPVALALIRKCGLPLAAPSANLSGRPSPTTAAHVAFDLSGRIAGLVDGGPADGVGLESTVVEATDSDGGSVLILRPGGVTREQLEEVAGVGRVKLDPSLGAPASPAAISSPQPIAALPKQTAGRSSAMEAAEKLLGSPPPASSPSDSAVSPSPSVVTAAASPSTPGPKAPGMKYTHYAPRAPLVLVDGSTKFLLSQAEPYVRQGDVVGILGTSEIRPDVDAWIHRLGIDSQLVHFLSCGSRSDLSTVARDLYSSLRAFDATPVQVIFSEVFSQAGVGEAVMNRLNKAAGGQRITETQNGK